MANHGAQLLYSIMNKISTDLNTMMIGRIEKYDKTDNMATVELLHNNPSMATQYSPLVKVPCAFFSMGGFKIQALPKKDDRVLLIYCDYDIENLLINGTVKPKTNRKHSLNDAIAIPLKINFLNDEELKSPINEGELVIGNSKGQIQITDDGKINLNSANGGTLDLSTIQGQLNQINDDFNNFSSDNYLTNIEANTLKNDLKKLQNESTKLIDEGTSLGLTQYVTNYQTALDNLNTELTTNWIDKTNYPLAITSSQRNNIITLLANVEMNKTLLISEINMEITKNANSYADSKLSNFIAEIYNADKADLQSQIDGEIQTWFYPGTPTFDNEPAKNWTDDATKNKHIGDLYYDTNTDTGHSYRFAYISNVYQWKLIPDSDVTKALADAAKAQDTADHKRRVFTITPVPPYDVGDLWMQGINGDALVCETAKIEGQTYVQGDFVTATKYTDDTKANEAKSAADNAQVDANKANTMLDAMANDGKITPNEKIKLKQEWDIVQSEANTTNGTIYTQAITYNVDTTAYEGAYTTVSQYLSSNDIFQHMGLISTIDRTTWDNDWKNYYNERTKLLNKISDIIQDNVSNVNQTVETTTKHVTDLADKIGYSIESNTFTSNGVIQSLQTTQTFVEENKDRITSTVTQTDVTNAVNNLQIGVRNLILNGDFSQGSKNWTIWNATNSSILANEYLGKSVINTNLGSLPPYGNYADVTQNIYNIKPNTAYTLSFYARGAWSTYIVERKDTGSTPTSTYTDHGMPNSTTTWDFQKFTQTFTTQPDCISAEFYFRVFDGCSAEITNIMLVEGNKAPSDFISAPEDQTAYTDNAVNNIQIGGTNLLNNTSNFVNQSNWYLEAGPGQTTIFDIASDSTYGNVLHLNKQNAVSWSVLCNDFSDYYKPLFDTSKEYTISFLVNALTANSTISVNFVDGNGQNVVCDGKTFTVSNSWTYCTYTFKPNIKGNQPALYIQTSTGEFWLTQFKLEEGSKDTTYSPAPQDFQTQIDTHTSQIEQNSKDISLKVSETDYTGNKIASLINQTATSIKLQASKINMTIGGSDNSKGTFNVENSNGNNIVTIDSEGLHQYDKSGNLAADIKDNGFNCYNWRNSNDFVGGIIAITESQYNNRGAVALYCDTDNVAALGYKIESGDIQPVFKVDGTRVETGNLASCAFGTNLNFVNYSNTYFYGNDYNIPLGQIGARNDNNFWICGRQNIGHLVFGEMTDNNSNAVALAKLDNVGLYVWGTIGCRDGKTRIVKTKNYGERCLNAFETPECYFADFGESQLINGTATIDIEKIYGETVDTTNCSYQVFLTKYGEGNIQVIERNPTNFVVTGDKDIKFGWQIVAKQLDYSDTRLQESPFKENEASN